MAFVTDPSITPGHVPVLAPYPGLACREPSLRLLYIDDALLASVVKLDQVCVPLLPTLGPHGRLASSGLGVPGEWLPLQHRLRDVDANARAVGMLLYAKKTNIMMKSKLQMLHLLTLLSIVKQLYPKW